jgi:hypothetical protein
MALATVGVVTVSTPSEWLSQVTRDAPRARPRPSWEFTRAAGLAHGYDLGFTSLDLVTSKRPWSSLDVLQRLCPHNHGIQIGVFHRHASSSSSEADRHSSVGCGCSVGCS